jgi:hypothetical protein
MIIWFIAIQRLCKYASVTTDMHATIKDVVETVFFYKVHAEAM